MIGISGKMGTGKDLCYQLIREEYPEAVNIKFAGPLKQIVAILASVDESVVHSREGKALQVDHLKSRTIRQLQQDIGEQFRSMYGPNVWVSLALKEAQKQKLSVITDVRYENEADAIHDAGGIVIRLTRNGIHQDGHVSETALDHYTRFDAHIDNTNLTRAQLKEQLMNIVKSHI